MGLRFYVTLTLTEHRVNTANGEKLLPMVRLNAFERQWAETGPDATRVFEETGASGWYILGRAVQDFERVLAEYWKLPHAIGVASGLDAIEISLRVLGCGTGDRVLTSPLSAFATTLAIAKTGAIPVFADTDPDGLLDLDACEDLLRQRPDIRYFVPVHLYGNPLPRPRLQSLIADFGLLTVEDCAQSIGATYESVPTGAAGQLAATSFYPTKNLGAMGDGGAILASDDGHAKLAKVLRDYGQTAKYRHEQLGYNSRLDELQAGLLHRVYLPRLDQWTARRREAAGRYERELRHENVRILKPVPGADPSRHLFPVAVPPNLRDHFQRHLRDSGIESGIHYPLAIPDQPAMARIPFQVHGDLAQARVLCASEVSLPIHPYLTEQEVESVVRAVNGWRPEILPI